MKLILYISLRIISSFRYFIRKRFTLAGKFILTGLTASAIFGLDTNKNAVYQEFTFLAALIFVSFVYNQFFRANLTIRRILPRFGSVGQTLPYSIQVKNQDQKILKGLTLQENLSDPRPSLVDFKSAGFSFKASFQRWKQLISINQFAVAEKNPVPVIHPKSLVEVKTGLLPLKRGRLEFASLAVGRTDPFGLIYKFITVHQKQNILILPRRYVLPDIKLPGTRAYQHGGVALSTSVADSEEFQSLREYRPGDPLRQIHWKSWAKAGKPIIKEYQDEFFVRHALILDTFMSAGQSAVFEEAVSVAASFACTVQTQESLLDLMFVGTEAYCETIGRGQGQSERLLEILACVKPCYDKPYSALHNLVVSRISSMSGCICILLSWNDERRKFIEHLKSLGIQILVIVVTNPAVLNSPSEGGIPDKPEWIHLLQTGRIEEGLAKL